MNNLKFTILLCSIMIVLMGLAFWKAYHHVPESSFTNAEIDSVVNLAVRKGRLQKVNEVLRWAQTRMALQESRITYCLCVGHGAMAKDDLSLAHEMGDSMHLYLGMAEEDNLLIDSISNK